MFNSLVQPHIDYCSQLWMPQEGQHLDKIEKVLKDFSKKLPGLKESNYWERLRALKMNSEQRRLERYQIIYIWKILQGLVPNHVSNGPQKVKVGGMAGLSIYHL